MSPFQNILPAILGFIIGLIWIVFKLGWLEWNKINDKYGIIIPSLVTIALPFIFIYISNLDFNLIKDLAPLGILFTITIGFLNYFWNQKIKIDEETTKQAVLALERAYEILTDQNQNINPPLADRYNWLATARMLARYEKLKKTLRTDLYKTMCEEQEEYWRHRFYLLIKDSNLYPLSYFEKSGDKLGIQPKSALIIFVFAGWKEGKLDPLDTIDSTYYQNASSLRHHSLIEYLSKYSKSIK